MSCWNEYFSSKKGVVELNYQNILTLEPFLYVLFGDSKIILTKENDEILIAPSTEVTATSKGRTCLLCGLVFTKLCDQMAHFKSCLLYTSPSPRDS